MDLARTTTPRPSPRPVPTGAIRATGTIEFVDAKQQFGILRPDDALRERYAGLEHVFFAIDQLRIPLVADTRVEFHVDPAVRDGKGYARATDVRPV